MAHSPSEAAERLIRLRDSEDLLEALPADLRPKTIEEGYALQAAVHARRAERGQGPYGGFKIGCTTAVMQAYLNIPEPCGGGVLASDLHASGAAFGPSKRRYGVECEIAVRLAKTLGGDGAPSMAQTRDAVGAVMAAIELVEDRYLEWREMDAPTLIADDFFQRACVLGDPIADWRDHDLSALIGEMTINGNEPLRGRGADILGHPLEALRWLAGRRVVPAGSIVMLGSVVQTQWLNAGDEAAVSLGGLSAAHLRIRARPA
jgi:2-oxo-3-hexenedioate decarboxylase/2-keto-4-pentenoate hydratase